MKVNDAQLLIHSNNLDGSTTYIDSSPVGNTVTVYDNAHHSTYQYKFKSSSMHFDGNGDYISCAANDAFSVGTDEFTMACWFMPLSDTTGRGIVACAGNGWTDESFMISDRHPNYATKYSVWYYNNGTPLLVSTSDIVENVWVHIEVTRDASGVVRLFINGVIEDSATYTGSINTIDRTYRVGNFNTYYLHGYMEEILFINGNALHQSNFAVPVYTYGQNLLLFSGYITELDTPVVRWAALYNRETKELIDSTESDTNGFFELGATHSGIYFVNIFPTLNDGYNILSYDNIILQ
jgi:hypothetical protein